MSNVEELLQFLSLESRIDVKSLALQQILGNLFQITATTSKLTIYLIGRSNRHFRGKKITSSEVCYS